MSDPFFATYLHFFELVKTIPTYAYLPVYRGSTDFASPCFRCDDQFVAVLFYNNRIPSIDSQSLAIGKRQNNPSQLIHFSVDIIHTITSFPCENIS